MVQAAKTVKGGCLCGAVRYSIAEAALHTGICHCSTCRKVASATSLPFTAFRSQTFAFDTGQPSELQSSPGVFRTFCSGCGSPLTYRRERDPEFIDIMTVSLDEPGAHPPTFHVWTSHMLDWDVLRDDLPAYAQSRE